MPGTIRLFQYNSHAYSASLVNCSESFMAAFNEQCEAAIWVQLPNDLWVKTFEVAGLRFSTQLLGKEGEPGTGYGGTSFTLKTHGKPVTLVGPWSSRPACVNKAISQSDLDWPYWIECAVGNMSFNIAVADLDGMLPEGYETVCSREDETDIAYSVVKA